MKKIFLVLMLGLLLSACELFSGISFLADDSGTQPEVEDTSLTVDDKPLKIVEEEVEVEVEDAEPEDEGVEEIILQPPEEVDCLFEAEVITPLGDWQKDGSYIAHDLGSISHWLVWDGELWLEGESKNDGIHDYIIFEGGYLDLRVWQGTLYQYCDLLDYDDVFSIVEDRMSPDKFATESGVDTIRIWKVEDNEFELIETIDRP